MDIQTLFSQQALFRVCYSLTFAAAALSVAATANAGSVSLSAQAPARDAVLVGSYAYPHSTGNIQFNKTTNQDRFGGNAFNLGQDSEVDAVTFYLHEAGKGVGGQTATISFVSFDALDIDSIGYPYTTAYSEAFVMPTLTGDEGGQYITFDFKKPVVLKAGTYGVVFAWKDAGQGRQINFSATQTGGEALDFRTTVDDRKSPRVGTTVNTMGGGREILFFVTGKR